MDRHQHHHTEVQAGLSLSTMSAMVTVPRELGGMPSLILWWLLSVTTVWEGLRMSTGGWATVGVARPRPAPRRPQTLAAPSSLEWETRWAREGAQIRRVMETVLGVTAWARPPRGTTQQSALRGFLLATALLFVVLAWAF